MTDAVEEKHLHDLGADADENICIDKLLLVKCDKNHTFEITFRKFDMGQRCPYCIAEEEGKTYWEGESTYPINPKLGDNAKLFCAIGSMGYTPHQELGQHGQEFTKRVPEHLRGIPLDADDENPVMCVWPDSKHIALHWTMPEKDQWAIVGLLDIFNINDLIKWTWEYTP